MREDPATPNSNAAEQAAATASGCHGTGQLGILRTESNWGRLERRNSGTVPKRYFRRVAVAALAKRAKVSALSNFPLALLLPRSRFLVSPNSLQPTVLFFHSIHIDIHQNGAPPLIRHGTRMAPRPTTPPRSLEIESPISCDLRSSFPGQRMGGPEERRAGIALGDPLSLLGGYFSLKRESGEPRCVSRLSDDGLQSES